MGLIGIVIFPVCSQAWATSDLATLPSPEATISPFSGPPGAKITITIYNLPDISNESYPYPDLYIYLPFSQPFGQGLQSHCGGLDCFPVYTHDDALKHNLANRTLVFSLPSTTNPNPVYLNGMENSVCDVTINEKTVERFSSLCNTKDQPQGTYVINLAWTLESNLDQKYVVKTIPFTVTQSSPSEPLPVANNGDLIIKEYQNGTISQSTFYAKLHSLGWNDEQIRQALAVIGKLPHQMGSSGPDNTLPLIQENSSGYNITKTILMNNTTSLNKTLSDNKSNTNLMIVQNSTSSIQNNLTYTKQETIPIVESYSWNNVIIILSVVAVSVMSGTIFYTKKLRR